MLQRKCQGRLPCHGPLASKAVNTHPWVQPNVPCHCMLAFTARLRYTGHVVSQFGTICLCYHHCKRQNIRCLPWQEAENGGPPRTGNGEAGYAAASYPPNQQDGLSDCILLAACGANELLPQSPHVPADVFTACLTTPIKASTL